MIINNRSYFHPFSLSFFSRVGQNNGGDLFPIEKNAVDFLVKQLIINNLWDKIIALYPFVGRSSLSFSFNLKNNLFRLSYIGTSITTNLGITSSGTSYANTNIQILSLGQNSISAGVYRTALGGTTNSVSADFGSSYTPTGNLNRFYISKDSTETVNFNGAVGFGSIGAASTSQGSLTGLGFKMFSCENNSSNGFRCWNNGINTYTTSGNQTWQQNGTILILSLDNGNTTYIGKQTLGLFFLSNGLSPIEAINLFNIIENFQKILGRSVN